jgi:hypothetical protein
VKTLNGKRIIDVESFLDNKIPDVEERLAYWQYELCAYMNQWELVLETKWLFASMAQGRIESHVKPMEVIEYESDCVGC